MMSERASSYREHGNYKRAMGRMLSYIVKLFEH